MSSTVCSAWAVDVLVCSTVLPRPGYSGMRIFSDGERNVEIDAQLSTEQICCARIREVPGMGWSGVSGLKLSW